MAFKENYKLRKPSGIYTVGCMRFEYEHEPEEKKGMRRIPCLCFYPSNVKNGLGSPKKYTSDSLWSGVCSIMTNSYWDINILPGKRPLLLFSTGLGSTLEQNTVQFEELASNGYIVLSIGHEGSSFFELKNGDICAWDSKEAHHEEKRNTQEKVEGYNKWLTESGNTASTQEQKRKYRDYMDSMLYTADLLDIWVKDSLVALEMLLKGVGEESVKIRSHVDKDRIAAFGMSFGGSTALRLSVESDLIKAGVSMDGTFYWNTDWSRTINKPLMLMHTEAPKAAIRRKALLSLLNITGDFYSVEIKNSFHVNFTDYNDILAVDENGFLGDIDPDIMERIINTLILDFFNKYFIQEQSKYLDTNFWKDYATVSKK